MHRVTGLNHITLAVSDVDKSLDFYTGILGLTGTAKWDRGAYLSSGDLWLCLSLDTPVPSADYCHIALSAEAADFDALCNAIRNSGMKQWKENQSEGASFYFCDPDGHKLELHVGNLKTRLQSLKAEPYEGLVWLDKPPA